jgi:two-component system, OmpR family, sensor histidine kinase ArlS
MNIRFKITLLFTLVVTGILSLICYSVFYFSELGREESFKIRLKGGAVNRARQFVVFGNKVRSLDSTSVGIIAKRFFEIYNHKGENVYEYYSPTMTHLKVDTGLLVGIKNKGEFFFNLDDISACGISYNDASNSLIVIFGGYDEDGKNRIKDLQNILLLSLLAGVLVTLVVGFVFSSQLVRPINRIIREVNEISSHNLSHRIYAGEGQDELSRLANTFNELLNRLQESFNIQRRFISNASHELSTPLTSISSQLQVTLHKDRTSEEYQHVLHSIQEDVEQMSQLTKSLLEIAKTGYEGGIELKEVRIDEILLKVVTDVKKLNNAYNVELEFGDIPDDDKECLAFGNVDLLYSALKNITENGCKYSPDKQAEVMLTFRNKQIIVEIKNQGDVIAEEEMENIFHPFYRSGNSAETKGFGLGLALAKRIISLHKGSIKVQSGVQTGTIFTIILPSLSTYYPQ